MVLINLKSTGAPVPVVSAGDGPTLVVNRDLTNLVLYGPPGIADQNVGKYSILDPLGSITLDGQSDVYALGNTGSPIIDVVPGSGSWSPSPAQIAAQINALGLATSTNQGTQIGLQTTNPNQTAALIATGSAAGTPGGVPLLRFTNQLGSGNLDNLPITTPQTLVNGAAVNQPGYEMWIALWFPVNSGTIPFATLKFQWGDSLSGNNIKTQNFVLTAGNAQANALSYYLNGPCFGDQLFVTLTNLDPAIAGTYDFVINQTSHVFQHDSILQPAYATGAAPFGFTNPNGTPGLGVLSTTVTAIAAAASLSRLLAVCSGRVFVEVDNLGGANVCRIRMLDPASGTLYGSGSANQSFFSDNIPASSTVGQEVALPRGPVLLELHNSGTTGTITPAVTITILDY